MVARAEPPFVPVQPGSVRVDDHVAPQHAGLRHVGIVLRDRSHSQGPTDEIRGGAELAPAWKGSARGSPAACPALTRWSIDTPALSRRRSVSLPTPGQASRPGFDRRARTCPPVPLIGSDLSGAPRNETLTQGVDHVANVEAPGLSRRRFFSAAAATVAAGQLGLLGFSRRLHAMTATLVEVDERVGHGTRTRGRRGSAVSRERFGRGARRPAPAHQRRRGGPTGNGRGRHRRACSSRRCRSSRATGRREYDWRKVEARLNALPNFITEIDGLDIHFIHVRSKHENALPMIVTHGWPGSIIEQLKIIEPADQSDGARRRARRTRSTS